MAHYEKCDETLANLFVPGHKTDLAWSSFYGQWARFFKNIKSISDCRGPWESWFTSQLSLYRVHLRLWCMDMTCDPPNQSGIVQIGKMHRNVSLICGVRAIVGDHVILSGWQTEWQSQMWCMVAWRLGTVCQSELLLVSHDQEMILEVTFWIMTSGTLTIFSVRQIPEEIKTKKKTHSFPFAGERKLFNYIMSEEKNIWSLSGTWLVIIYSSLN